ncbi:MAG: glycoside hydrolase family 99-like domain-containing protein [Rhodospirillales bacterium]
MVSKGSEGNDSRGGDGDGAPDVSTLRRKLQELEAAYAADRIALARLRQALAARDDVVVARQTVQAILDDLIIEHQRVTGSLSWRVTRPLRGLASLFRREKNSKKRPTPAAISPTIAMEPARPVRLVPVAADSDRPGTEPAAALDTTPAVLPPALPAVFPAPEAFPDLFDLKAYEPTADVAVVFHIYYPELAEEVLAILDHLPGEPDIFISLVVGKSDRLAASLQARYPRARILVFPNHGRDVYPFVALVNTSVLCKYRFVLKIHTKKSLHRNDGDNWRQSLIGEIAGSRARVRQVMALMEGDPDCAFVVAAGNRLTMEFLGSNLDTLYDLLARMDYVFDPEEMTFPAGSIYWVNPFILRLLQSLGLGVADFEPEDGRIDGTMAHAVERIIGIIARASGMTIVTSDELDAALEGATPAVAPTSTRLIAFYLPQYHPIPENDAWWGKGFTEWSNVARACRQYEGHAQPRLPADLGFYDLRVEAVAEAQANLARAHGVAGFCYYYYWFDGRPILDMPLQRMLVSGRPDWPFCLCWANENWTRSWDGLNKEVLIAQHYSPDVIPAFARDVGAMMTDRRYLRHAGKPVLLVYRITDIPDYRAAVRTWRAIWREMGVGEVHLAAVRFWTHDLPERPDEAGLDAYVDFPPHGVRTLRLDPALTGEPSDFAGAIFSYDEAIAGDLDRYAEPPPFTVHRGVMMGWDNTARRGKQATIFHGASPARFRYWLRHVLRQEDRRSGGAERLVFINAWNEWAEGTYLEPDVRYGLGWLEAVRSSRTGGR